MMWKKVLLSIIIVIILIFGLRIFNNVRKINEPEQENTVNVVDNQTELSGEYVTDDCIDEWEDYAIFVQEELKDANSSLSDEDKIYILKAENNNIEVYYINENNEEILYKVTDISTKYLPKEDVESLERGIKVEGVQKLNQLLEDFE